MSLYTAEQSKVDLRQNPYNPDTTYLSIQSNGSFHDLPPNNYQIKDALFVYFSASAPPQ